MKTTLAILASRLKRLRLQSEKLRIAHGDILMKLTPGQFWGGGTKESIASMSKRDEVAGKIMRTERQIIDTVCKQKP